MEFFFFGGGGLFLNNRVMLVKVLNVVIFQGVQFRAVHCADLIIAHPSGT